MEQINRREFIARNIKGPALASACVCGLSGCATFTKVGATPALPGNAYAAEPPTKITVFLTKATTLAGVGGSAKIVDAALPEPMIIARVEPDRFVAASLRCTHRGVELEYQSAQKRFRCASLGHSKFALDGQQVGGPAHRPIKVFATSIENGNLVIRL